MSVSKDTTFATVSNGKPLKSSKPRKTKFFQICFLPHECGVPLGDGTPHSCGSEELCLARAPNTKLQTQKSDTNQAIGGALGPGCGPQSCELIDFE
jgi:hypothetical protein